MKNVLTCALVLSALSFLSPKTWGSSFANCRLDKCAEISKGDLDQVAAGKTLVYAESDPASPLKLAYVVTSIGQVDPVFATATFIDFGRHKEIHGIDEVNFAARGKQTLVGYKLDVSKTLSGVGKVVSMLGGHAYYAGLETLISGPNSYGVEWLIDDAETKAMNSGGKGNPKTMPSHFHGYVVYKYYPEYGQTFQIYAGYQVVDKLTGFMMKPFIGMINSSSRESLEKTAVAFAGMIKNEAALPEAERKAGWKERCNVVLNNSVPKIR